MSSYPYYGPNERQCNRPPVVRLPSSFILPQPVCPVEDFAKEERCVALKKLNGEDLGLNRVSVLSLHDGESKAKCASISPDYSIMRGRLGYGEDSMNAMNVIDFDEFAKINAIVVSVSAYSAPASVIPATNMSANSVSGDPSKT